MLIESLNEHAARIKLAGGTARIAIEHKKGKKTA